MVDGPDQTAKFSALLQVMMIIILLTLISSIDCDQIVSVRIKIMFGILQAVGAPHGQWLPHTR